MPSFPKPTFQFNYQTQTEIARLRNYRDNEPGRQIPAKAANRLLIGTWNIANLGAQQRRTKDYRLIAEIISWFDIVAIQETKDDLAGLRAILAELPVGWRTLFSDHSGNDERLAFLYDGNKVQQLEKVGEIAIAPKDLSKIKLPGIAQAFTGFDRNPYVAAFVAGTFRFLLVNVHLFFGSDKKADVERRALEALATARWADLRTKDKDAYTTDIIALGDFNIPKVEPGDPIYSVLRDRGLERPPHSTQIAGSIATDAEYDQIMFFPGQTENDFTGAIGVFDFDGVIFRGIWQSRTPAQFRAYVRYYLSDHRPLWAQFKI